MNELYKKTRRAILLAGKLRKQLNISSRAVNLEKVCKRINISIVKGQFDPGNDISGFIKRSDDGSSAVIVVNDKDSDVRQRFTIAHEIGHFFLHTTEILHVDRSVVNLHFRDAISSKATDIKEIEANQFAAEFLIPISILRSDVKKYANEDPNIDLQRLVEILAKEYSVSQTAMTIRLSKVLKLNMNSI